jgi:hypothetical protein
MVPSTSRDGKALWHAESNTQHNDFKFAWPDLDIPAQWNTVFTYTLNFGSDWPGIPKGEYPSVEIRGELLQTSRQKLYHLGRDAGHHPSTSLLPRGKECLANSIIARAVLTYVGELFSRVRWAW